MKRKKISENREHRLTFSPNPCHYQRALNTQIKSRKQWKRKLNGINQSGPPKWKESQEKDEKKKQKRVTYSMMPPPPVATWLNAIWAKNRIRVGAWCTFVIEMGRVKYRHWFNSIFRGETRAYQSAVCFAYASAVCYARIKHSVRAKLRSD